MKISGIALPAGTLLLGLLSGSIWSPRAKEPTAEQIAQAASQLHSSKSNNHPSDSSSLTQTNSSKSGSRRQRNGISSIELTPENLIGIFAGIDDESEINPMEFARYAAQISNLNELESIALLKSLQGPFDEDDYETGETAGIVSVIVFSRLCEVNGPEAMRMLDSGELGEELVEEMSGIGMNSWVAADPDGASRWINETMGKIDELALSGADLDELEELNSLSEELMASYVHGMSAIDPEKLKNNIASYQSDEVRDTMQELLTDQLVNKANSKEEITALLEDPTLDSDYGKTDLVRKLSATDPELAADYAQSQPQGRARDEMLASVAEQLINENPAEGAEWYQQQELSPDSSESKRLQKITSQWMHQDLEEAASWLLEQPNTSERDAAESSLAQQSANSEDWDAAFEWSADISDPEKRKNATNQIIRQAWNSYQNTFNPEAAEAARRAGLENEIRPYLAQ